MQEPVYNELSSKAAEDLFKNQEAERASALEFARRGQEAQEAVTKVLEQLRAQDKVLILTQDEEELIRAYRRWRLRQTKAHGTFRWQVDFSTILAKGGEIEVVPETGLISHPNEGVE